ncbi:outer membrane protein assembly factor BamA [Novipirellula caenicola]|uniref:Outer membrane protein assembly factor BamA n=2 Tax=Novipirellula caenicola TaxID=1536901 RepID=A0ABP9VRF9_9BACT
MSSYLILIAVAIPCCTCITASAQTAPIANRIEMVGNRSFSKHTLLKELKAQPEFLIASHAFGDESKLANVIERLLVKGYRNEGFDQASVQCQQVTTQTKPSLSRWEIIIDEGKQIRCGQVRIQSAKQIDPQSLERRLTQAFAEATAFPNFVEINGNVITHWVNEQGKESKLKDPVWKTGDEVRFDSELGLRQQVIQAIEDLGFSRSDVLVRFEVDRDKQTADLLVEILDEGVADRISEIDIQGNSINTKEQILAYLGVSVGDPIARRDLQQWTKRLWDSGRFKKHQFRFDKQTQSLSLEVEECSGLPPLDEPINKIATVLLKASQWLAGIAARGDDIETFNAWGNDKLLVIESNDGLFAEFRSPLDTSTDAQSETVSLLIDRDRFILNHSALPQCLRIPLSSMDGQIQFSTEHFADPEPNKFLKGTFTLAGNTKRDENEAPLRFNFRSSPVNWLPLAYKDSVHYEFIGGDLILTHGKESIRIDVESGKVNQWTTRNGMLRFAPGLLSAARSTFLGELPEADQHGQQHRQPVTATVAFLTSDPVIQTLNRFRRETPPLIDPLQISAIRKLNDGGMLRGCDLLLTWMGDDANDEKFDIPVAPSKNLSSEQIVWNVGSRIALLHIDKVFQEGTWPSMLSKEFCLRSLGASKYTSKVVQQLAEAPSSGPICLAALTLMLKQFRSDLYKRTANIGLQRLSPEAFSRDYDALTAVIGDDFFVRLRRSIATLTDAEMTALENALPIARATRLLRRIQHTTIQAEESESQYWYRVAHDPLAAWLQQNAG